MKLRLLVFCLVLTLPAWAGLPPVHPDRGEAAYQRALGRAATDLRLLCFAAHPDDEDGATLAYYALGRGIHAYTALANYGEGGQNEIGSQLYGDLAALRARETRAAADLLGVREVLCMGLTDFGYSKSLAETLEKWGRDRVLEQMVLVIRHVRPDVIITNHREGEGHGHHQALAALLLPAVAGAADPRRFPEQEMRGLAAWKVARVFQRRNLPFGPRNEDYHVRVPVGEYDAMRGASYLQIAAGALKQHRSQGRWSMVDGVLPEAAYTDFVQIHPEGERVQGDLFEGLADGFAPGRGYDGIYDASGALTAESLAPVNQAARQALAAADRQAAGAALGRAHVALKQLAPLAGGLPLSAGMSDHQRTRLRADILYLHQREEDLAEALWECVGLHARLTCDDPDLVRGQTFSTRLTVTALGPITVEELAGRMLLPFQWQSQTTATELPIPLSPGQTARFDFENRVFHEARVANPAEDAKQLVQPRPPVKASVTARAFDTEFSRIIQADARVAPELEIVFSDPFAHWVRPASGVRPVELFIQLRNNSPEVGEGRLSLLLPNPLRQMGGRLEPEAREYALPPGDSQLWRLRGELSDETPLGRFSLFVLAEGGGRHSAAAEARLAVLDASLPETLRVAVLPSYDDTLPRALRALGADVTLLDAARLPFLSLDGFDSIFLDMRAYLVHPELGEHNRLFLDYARGGGNLVVMYQKTEEWKSEYAPYPLVLGRERVTLQDAPVRILEPSHPLLLKPNELTEGAWNGWVQERGLYFPAEADARYLRLLSTSDPGEPALETGWLVAEVEQGSYIYTSLAWYRQLREGNAGAYRALANMAAFSRR